MRVAAVADQSPAEWLFAIDRSAAARLRSEVNRELLSRGKPELPYIEELESALAPPAALPAVDPGSRLVGSGRRGSYGLQRRISLEGDAAGRWG